MGNTRVPCGLVHIKGFNDQGQECYQECFDTEKDTLDKVYFPAIIVEAKEHGAVRVTFDIALTP